jgi:CRISPR system Cascade subunit CasC
MFVEVHMLQNFAPSNLNRDDTGNPKDSEFGGVRRARISSQCIKRAIRLHPVFARTTEVEPATRTRWITRLIVKPLIAAGKPAEQAQSVAETFATQYCKMDSKEKSRSSVLLYLSASEIQAITQALLRQWDNIVAEIKENKGPLVEGMAKELFKAIKDRTSAPDIALFGRMLAEKPELNIDAACQVAHALSTHRVNMEMDFYTAVDDLSTDEETGAGMMGVTGFNSACFYRYARVDWEQLLANLGGDAALARKTVEGFLRAAVLAIPTGKQNSFAAQNMPDFLLGVARDDGQSWSLANAFETPVRPARDGGLMAASIEKLDAYWGSLAQKFGQDGLEPVVLAVPPDAPLTHLRAAAVPNLDTWVTRLVNRLPGG